MICKIKENNKIAIVVAKRKVLNSVELCLALDALAFPYFYKLDDVLILDDHIPSDWIEVKHDNGIILESYPTWAKDVTYYSQLDESNTAEYKEYTQRTNSYINSFASQKFGSIDAAWEAISKQRLSNELKLRNERGYELQESIVSDSEKDKGFDLSELVNTQ